MKATVKNARNKREEKKQTNIKWNSRLFFQLGVIMSLLIVFFIMQTNFEMKSVAVNPRVFEGVDEPPIIHYELDVDKPKPVETVKKTVPKKIAVKQVVKASDFEVKLNDTQIEETPIAPTNIPVNTAEAPVEEEPATPIFLKNVEFVPVYPGCESLGTNAEKIDCMSSKINDYINRNFRKELLEDLRANETYRIYVNFKINSNGYVSDVVANSHSETLKKEAQRVIKNLPSMRPGKQGDKNVDVLYTVPIVFKIQ